jgi:transcription elongation factor GreA
MLELGRFTKGDPVLRAVRDRLEGELRALERELNVELPREIKTAVAMGDLRENAEYHAALERQRYVRARIGQLRTRLSELATLNLDRIPKDRVGLGSTIVLLDLDSDEEVTYELVIPEMSDLDKGLISIASPIGKGLMGKQVEDAVTIVVPSGHKKFEILELRTLHDKAEADDVAGDSEA